MKMKIILFCCFLLSCCCTVCLCERNGGSSWINFLRCFKIKFDKCIATNESFVWRCLEKCSFQTFDEFISNDVIPLTDTIRLVRRKKDPTQNALVKRYDMREINFQQFSWQERILAKFQDVLKTHSLQVDVEDFQLKSESRGRHRKRNHMLPVMMFGVTALGMVLVPIGFQFMALIVGKALLMSKLALILASINGLKRIASSGLNFGLYQIPETHAYYDREDIQQQRL